MKSAAIIALAIAISSCTVAIDPATNRPVPTIDTVTVNAITDQIIAELNRELARDGK